MTVRVVVEPLIVGRCRHLERVVRRGGRWRIVDFPALALLIRHPSRGAVLVDTGYSDHFHDATAPFPERLYRWATPVTLPEHERLGAQLAARGLAPDDVRHCLVSHAHADHVAGLRDLPRARFACSRAERDWLGASARVRGVMPLAVSRGLLPALFPDDFDDRLDLVDDAPGIRLDGPWAGLGPARDLFGDGSLLAVALPGHTPGQVGLVLTDERDRRVLFCADAAWSRHAWLERDLPSRLAGILTADTGAYVRTIERLATLARTHPELVILPSHCTESLARYTGAVA